MVNQRLSPSSSPPQLPHILLFPFMSKGHTIPMIHLAHLFLRRNVSVTIITTPLNSPFIHQSLTDTSASIISLPFPKNVDEIPSGCESTDKLPSMSLFLTFTKATKLMQNDFELLVQTLPHVSCIVSDGFLWWTQSSAEKLSLPRIVFYGMNTYAMTISGVVTKNRSLSLVKSDDELFTVPDFPGIQLTKNDFEYPFNDPDATGEFAEFVFQQIRINSRSKGYLVNSFYDLEAKFIDYWNRKMESKIWVVGPLGLTEPTKVQPVRKPIYAEWLDEKLMQGKSVLYVAFGSQAEITEEQYREIATGLERSGVNFLWAVRSKWPEDLTEFEQRVIRRGFVVRTWVEQVKILSHKSVCGFMSHCGWNSVMESICEYVPILAWPMMAEQHLNARLVVDELGVGIRVHARNGSVRGFVGSECVEMMVKELMEGEKGKEVRKRVKEIGEMGRKAVEEDGSSWKMLGDFLEQVCVLSLREG